MISACLLAAALVFSNEDAKAAFDLTDGFVRECTPRDAGTIRGRLAALWLLGKASAYGADVYRDEFADETPQGSKTFTNLYCPFERCPGGPWTVLVSHYDTKPGSGCPGANDGASTSCLLVQLARVLFDSRDFGRNVMLIWTDGEECVGERYTPGDGLHGSKRAAEMLKRRKLDVDAVYVLDMLGDRDLKISIPANVSMDLAKRVVRAAKAEGVKRRQLDRIDSGVLDDHLAFAGAGYRAIDLIDFEYGSAPGANDYWHTRQDTMDKLSVDSYSLVGRLVCRLLSTEEGR